MAAKPIIMTITNTAKNAMLDNQNLGITLRLNRLAIGSGRYTPTGNETGLASEISRHVITAGDIEPNTHTLRLFSVVTAETEVEVWELGLYDTENRLFAIASATDKPLFKVYPDIEYVGSFALKLDNFDTTKIQVTPDPNGALSIVLMSQHLAHSNPHPQYLLRGGGKGTADDLIARIAALENRIYEAIAVGGIYTTTKPYASGNEVHDDLGYGVWTRFGQGKVLVGYSTIATDDAKFKTMSNVFEIGSEIENQKAIVTQFWKRLPDNYIAPTYDIYFTSDAQGLNRIGQINEDSAIYLWIDVANAIAPINVSNFTQQGAGEFISDSANLTYPTTINNGKNLMIGIAPENYHVDMQTIIDWGFTLTDNMSDIKTDVHSALTINDTVSDAPPPPPEPTGRIVFAVYKTGEQYSGDLIKDVVRVDLLKNLDNVQGLVAGYTAGATSIYPTESSFPSTITNFYTQVVVTQPSIYDGTNMTIPYFNVCNKPGYAFSLDYWMGNDANWHTSATNIPIDTNKPFKYLIINYPAP